MTGCHDADKPVVVLLEALAADERVVETAPHDDVDKDTDTDADAAVVVVVSVLAEDEEEKLPTHDQ